MSASKFDKGLVLGRFSLTELIQAHGTIVYEAVDTTNESKVVVKIASPNDDRASAGAASVQIPNENNVLTGPLLGCPGVPTVLGFGETVYSFKGTSQRLPVIVESPFGRSLALEVDPDHNKLYDWGTSIYHTLREIHSRGIIHRDIKPSNIIIAADGSPVIIDFGIACSYESSSTLRSFVCGTKAYISSRIFGGYPADLTTDIDSLLYTTHSLENDPGQWTSLEHPSVRPISFPKGGVTAKLQHYVTHHLSANPHPRVLSHTCLFNGSQSTAPSDFPSASPILPSASPIPPSESHHQSKMIFTAAIVVAVGVAFFCSKK